MPFFLFPAATDNTHSKMRETSYAAFASVGGDAVSGDVPVTEASVAAVCDGDSSEPCREVSVTLSVMFSSVVSALFDGAGTGDGVGFGAVVAGSLAGANGFVIFFAS